MAAEAAMGTTAAGMETATTEMEMATGAPAAMATMATMGTEMATAGGTETAIMEMVMAMGAPTATVIAEMGTAMETTEMARVTTSDRTSPSGLGLSR